MIGDLFNIMQENVHMELHSKLVVLDCLWSKSSLPIVEVEVISGESRESVTVLHDIG